MTVSITHVQYIIIIYTKQTIQKCSLVVLHFLFLPHLRITLFTTIIILNYIVDYCFQIKSNQKFFIHTYKQVHSVYKSKVFKSIYIYTNTSIVDIMYSIYMI